MSVLAVGTSIVARTFVRHRGAFVPICVVALLGVLLFPLPAAVLSLLLLVNLALAILIMLTTVYVREPLEFAVFPSVLLITTLYRLVLNVASTRLILSKAYVLKLDAAGSVIKAFGSFVAGDSPLIGFVIFCILIVIQFVVITKGATRISEVAARFTLDGMPGKQMSIDADLNAGLIDETEARRRRHSITREADFYGAMDGASKFVRGDAIAGIIITIINIVGGLIIGVSHQMGLADAANVYTRLTIGDGLVSQIPAFIISISAALLVTRATSVSNLGEDVLNQVFGKPMALFISAGFLLALALTDLPKIPLLLLAGGCAGIAYVMQQSTKTAAKVKAAEQKTERKEPEPVTAAPGVDPLEIEVGYGLIRMVDRAQGGDLRERVQAIRRQLAEELGIVIPPIRIRDNTVKLGGNDYVIKIKGVPIATGTAYPDYYLAMDSGLATGKLTGIETKEPAFGLPATWVTSAERARAENMGYTVVDAASVVATHLTETVKSRAWEILTRQRVQEMLDNVKRASPALVDELVPALLRVADVQKVLQNLLRERVSIRDIETILETLGDFAPRTKDAEILTEYVRNALGRWICRQYEEKGKVFVVTVAPTLEDRIAAAVQHGETGSFLSLPPESVQQVTAAAVKELTRLLNAGHLPVILSGPQIRAQLKRIIEGVLPSVVVLAYNEIAREVEVESMGTITVDK
jgi:flagellar biosynthesis protein FlhA